MVSVLKLMHSHQNPLGFTRFIFFFAYLFIYFLMSYHLAPWLNYLGKIKGQNPSGIRNITES